MDNYYDFIICGGGFSGLTQAYFLSKYTKNKRILILEPKRNPLHFITFSFWKDDNSIHELDKLVEKRWKNITFRGVDSEFVNTLDNYSYCTIHGKRYEEYIKSVIGKNEDIEIKTERVVEIFNLKNSVKVNTEGGTYKSKIVFNSIYTRPSEITKSHFLTQNIGGWLIETEEDSFDGNTMTMFDFRTGKIGWNFIYVLPYSSRKALIENIGLEHSSEELIKDYIENTLFINKYRITYKEGGNTPMTDYRFPLFDGDRIINIGKHGGMIKPTTGFAFTNVIRRCEWLAKNINDLKIIHKNYEREFSNRIFRFSDSLMLHLMDKKPEQVQRIFENVFLNASSDLLFKFLDENLTLKDTLRLIWKLKQVIPTFARILIEDVISI